MLTELSIENLGVIERATLQLKRGMTVLTGETGAGKTILVDAIKLVMGGRTDPAIVRHGTDEARVDARFEVIDDGQLVERVVSRVVPAEGRSRAYLDGRPVTASTLADLSADLVELHGQHAHQRLLSTSAQRQVVDHYGQIDLSNWHQLRRQDVELTATQAELGGDERARAREIDLLEFQIAEIAAAELDDPDEDLHLAADEALLAHAADHQEAGQRVLYAFDSDQGISDQVSSVLGELDGRQPYHGITDRLNALAADLDDAVRDLRHLAESIEDDPQRLEEIRVRRQLLADLRRKYGDNLAEVMAFHDQAVARLADLEGVDEKAAALERQRSDVAARLAREASAIADARRRAAPRLAHSIQTHLRDLAMSQAMVSIEVGGDDPADEVTFLLSANPGSPPRPLTKVASGGELARVMLAIRLNMIDDDGATLVFDEVDAGIGGTAAISVGSALAHLGERHQVIVVTHLAQVAAQADHQIRIVKRSDGQSTLTKVVPVSGEDRVVELARMLAGTVTDRALDHARDLLASSET